MARSYSTYQNGLTENQERFCRIIALNPEITQAAAYKKAYPRSKGNNETCRRKAALLLSKDTIRTRIEELKAPALERAEKELGANLFSSIKFCIDALELDPLNFFQSKEIMGTKIVPSEDSDNEEETQVITYPTGEFTLVLKNLEDVPQELRRMIESIKPGRYGLEIKFPSKQGILDILNKLLGNYKKDNEQKQFDLSQFGGFSHLLPSKKETED